MFKERNQTYQHISLTPYRAAGTPETIVTTVVRQPAKLVVIVGKIAHPHQLFVCESSPSTLETFIPHLPGEGL